MQFIHLSLGKNGTEASYASAAAVCEHYGLHVVSTDRERGGKIGQDYMQACDTVIADLRKYEVGEPDPSIVFDLGIAFARQKKLYGYLLDDRNHLHRYPYAHFGPDGSIIDQYGLHYTTALTLGNLMYSVPAKMVSGDMDLCVKTVFYDEIERLKQRGQRITPMRDLRYSKHRKQTDSHLAYLAGYECFYLNETELGKQMVRLCRNSGFRADFPTSPVSGMRKLDFADLMNPLAGIAASFDHNQYKIQMSDIIIANLNPYHGLLPDCGTVFELGMAVGLGHLCVVFYNTERDALARQQSHSHGWLVDQRQYEPMKYEQSLRTLFQDNLHYVHGDFPDAVQYVRRTLKR